MLLPLSFLPNGGKNPRLSETWLVLDNSRYRKKDYGRAKTTIGMAKSLHLRVIAEGVETEAQMSFLRAQQCDEIQGFYFSKPLSADDAAYKLRRTVGNDLAIHDGTR